MKLVTKILFFILAGIILLLGFVLGTFILTFIFVLLVLMTVLFIIMWLFNNLITLFKSGFAKLAFKSIFSTAVTCGLISLLLFFTSKHFYSLEASIAISTLWVITTMLFGALWYLLHLKRQTKKHIYLWDEYKKNANTLNTWDVLVILVFPSLIVYVFNAIYLFA